MTTASFPALPFAAVRERLIARDETALLDVREEDPFAQEHPLWAANLPLSRIEIEAWRRIPRRDTLIVLYGEHQGTDLAPLAARPSRRSATRTCTCSKTASRAGAGPAANCSAT